MASGIQHQREIMKRLSVVCGLFHLVTWLSFASVLTQHSAFGQSSGFGGASGLAGGPGGFGPGGFSIPGPLTGRGEKEVAAIRDRCLMLSSKFNHNGVEFQSKTGIGCIIATPQGQRILAMPLSMTQPIEIAQERANGKLTIPSSLLLAGKLGSDKESRERLEAFAAQVADMPTTDDPTDFALGASERKIYRALSERTDELSFNEIPLSSVMKRFREQFWVPIVIDERALKIEQVTPDEPITLELPEVSFRSALNLILDPLKLTYVVENEVLKITTKKGVRARASEPNAVEQASEQRIYEKLNLIGEVNFNGMPLSGVMKFFQEEHQIPIVIDAKALEAERLSIDEPITLELPSVSIRSALNLVLNPLKLTHVIGNEVLKVTTKTVARRIEKETTQFLGTSQKGTVAYSYYGGMPSGGMGGPGMAGGGMGVRDSFELATVHRYGTSLEAQLINRSIKLLSGDMGGSMGGKGGSMGGGMGGDNRKREYAAIQGPLAVQVNADLGVAFISLPGDFQSIAIPTQLEPTNKQFVMVENAVIALMDKVELARNSVPEGAPVVNERGEPVGMYIAEKVVSFPQLFEALMQIDTKSLGYWGAESAKYESQVVESQVVEGMPELIPAELKTRIEKAAVLQGKEKTKAMKELRALLSTQVTDRNRFAERKIEILNGKLATLTRLTNELKKRDSAEVNKFLPKELALEIQENVENDPSTSP
jgi:hypothetical protein